MKTAEPLHPQKVEFPLDPILDTINTLTVAKHELQSQTVLMARRNLGVAHSSC